MQLHAAVGLRLDAAGLVALTVTQLDGRIERRLGRVGQPVHRSGLDPVCLHQGVVVTLHHHQRVTSEILASDVPGRLLVATTSTDFETAALAERVEGEAAMCADTLTLGRFDRTRVFDDVLREELAKRSLADEANTGAVRFVVDR